ncbi:MAG: HlyD family efflux transporter periplasmic adaptor subunit [Planctomycetota bacterium]
MRQRRDRQRRTPSRRGSAAIRLVVGLLCAAILSVGGMYAIQFKPQQSPVDKAVWYEAERGDFELAITERGEIESADDVEIRSEVKTKNQPGLAILRIVPEGTEVSEGDFLIELDSSALREELTLQQIAVNTFEALVVEARNLHETAKITKQEYLEGTFVQEKETFESELFVAEENLSRAEEYLQYSKKLAAKGYVNDLQLEADEFAVEKAKKEADAARTKLQVLQKFTRAKMLKQCESDILITKAKWQAEQNSLRLEQEKLQEIKDQIAKCMLHAPRAGMVKYAHTSDRRGNEDFIVEEGAVVRERQVLIRMPNSSSMRVEMKINESLVQYIKPGLEAEIRPIGAGDDVLCGKVEYVNQYAEPSGWRKANVKEYKAYVRVESPSSALRSGMTASVTIRSVFEPNVVQTPVQAVYLHYGQPYVFVRSGKALDARPVVCGPTNDQFFVIRSGVAEAEQVAVNPRALLDFVSLPEPETDESPAEGPDAKPRKQPKRDAVIADRGERRPKKVGS